MAGRGLRTRVGGFVPCDTFLAYHGPSVGGMKDVIESGTRPARVPDVHMIASLGWAQSNRRRTDLTASLLRSCGRDLWCCLIPSRGGEFSQRRPRAGTVRGG